MAARTVEQVTALEQIFMFFRHFFFFRRSFSFQLLYCSPVSLLYFER